MTLYFLTPQLRDFAAPFAAAIADRLDGLGLKSATMEDLVRAIDDLDLLAAQTAANRLELILYDNGFLPDDNLAKLRYLLAEGDPRIMLAPSQPLAPELDAASARLNDLTSPTAYRAAHAYAARHRSESA